MSCRAPKREEYTVKRTFYHCCFHCMTITKFEKGQKIRTKDLCVSGGWHYLSCPKCHHWGTGENVNIDLSLPTYVISFPYAFMEEE